MEYRQYNSNSSKIGLKKIFKTVETSIEDNLTKFENIINDGLNEFDRKIKHSSLNDIVNKKKKNSLPVSIDEVNLNTKIVLTNNLDELNISHFKNFINLNEIVLPNSITKIHSKAFENCFNLQKIQLPDNLVYIGKKCFKNCSKLKQITIPEKVVYIGSSCFFDCHNLMKINIPKNLTSLPKKCFYNNFKLKEIIIPPNVTFLSANCFGNCKNIEKIILPLNIIIEEDCFDGCDKIISSKQLNEKLSKTSEPIEINHSSINLFEDLNEIIDKLNNCQMKNNNTIYDLFFEITKKYELEIFEIQNLIQVLQKYQQKIVEDYSYYFEKMVLYDDEQ